MGSVDFNPTMIVFAGNNGSGKSTFRSIITEKHGILLNIDPDALARKYTANPELKAGRDSIKLVQEQIIRSQDFSIETTLSGNLPLRQMEQAKKAGYEIIMYYLGIENIEINIDRIALRVRNGGHHIPTEDVLRRKDRSIKNLLKCIHLVDSIYLVDNTDFNAQIIAEIENGELIYFKENSPQWIIPILSELK
ncbi:zeta toxin family protein [Jeotgalibacillus aurantiacus]|uniref:zeta toxin family protein n=1 Tax=Jeotgalibacillus aurantiacus TaxID=2763266 RepID=UPI001D0B4485|nr:zeta toxin family protein [Jeotgalibacillus aurantiacus]